MKFETTRVEILPNGTRITLPHGGVVYGEPHDTDEYRATAERLGYGSDTLSMCVEHEATHVRLCDMIGLPMSPVMSTVSGVTLGDSNLHALEEAAVLAVQTFAQAARAMLCDPSGGATWSDLPQG